MMAQTADDVRAAIAGPIQRMGDAIAARIQDGETVPPELVSTWGEVAERLLTNLERIESKAQRGAPPAGV